MKRSCWFGSKQTVIGETGLSRQRKMLKRLKVDVLNRVYHSQQCETLGEDVGTTYRSYVRNMQSSKYLLYQASEIRPHPGAAH